MPREVEPFVMPLFGLPCHVCGLPSQWFVEGISHPCGCGLQAVPDHRRREVRLAVLAAINDYDRTRAKAAA